MENETINTDHGNKSVFKLILLILVGALVGIFAIKALSSPAQTPPADNSILEQEQNAQGSVIPQENIPTPPNQNETGSTNNNGETTQPPLGNDTTIQPATFTITYTSQGFSPKELEVKTGDTVKFTNDSPQDFWPASAIHPTHKVYPGSDIQKCFTPDRESKLIFDACKGIPPGSSWSFTFNEDGEWGYHDHNNASNWGKVKVIAN